MLQSIPLSGTAKQIIFGLITLLIYVSTGVCRSYIAFLLHQLEQSDSNIHLDDDQKTWLASSVGLLTPFAALAAGILMDRMGRKICIIFMFIPLIFSWTLISIAKTYTMLLIAMSVESVALGMGVSIIYVSEIATAEYRGLLLAMVDVTLNLGVILCNVLMYYLKWNTVSIIFIGMSVLCAILAFILPESPVWLYSKGQKEKSIKILCCLRSKEKYQLEAEIQDMENSYTKTYPVTGILVTLKKCFSAWKQFGIALLLFMLVVLAGPLILLSYTVLVIDRLQIPYDGPTIALIYSIAGFCGSFLTPFFVHNLKRRVVLGISSTGMTICMLVISLYEFFFFESITEKPCAWILPSSLCLFTLLNNMGIFPILFVIGAELFPLEVRGTLQGINGFITSFIWSFSLKFYPLVMFDFGIRPMIWCFTAASLVLVLYTIFILPETKDKTLNQVQEQYFSKKKHLKNNLSA